MGKIYIHHNFSPEKLSWLWQRSSSTARQRVYYLQEKNVNIIFHCAYLPVMPNDLMFFPLLQIIRGQRIDPLKKLLKISKVMYLIYQLQSGENVNKLKINNEFFSECFPFIVFLNTKYAALAACSVFHFL